MLSNPPLWPPSLIEATKSLMGSKDRETSLSTSLLKLCANTLRSGSNLAFTLGLAQCGTLWIRRSRSPISRCCNFGRTSLANPVAKISPPTRVPGGEGLIQIAYHSSVLLKDVWRGYGFIVRFSNCPECSLRNLKRGAVWCAETLNIVRTSNLLRFGNRKGK